MWLTAAQVKERTWMLGLPTAVSKLIELLESVHYKFDSSEIPAVKTGIKAGKTGQEILEEYQPYKQLLADIVAAAVPGVALQDGDEDSTAQSSQGAAAVASSTKTEQLHQCTTMHEEGALS